MGGGEKEGRERKEGDQIFQEDYPQTLGRNLEMDVSPCLFTYTGCGHLSIILHFTSEKG